LGPAFALTAGARTSGPRTAALFRGEVIRFDPAAITVRGRKDSRVVRTFTYSRALRAKVDKLLETSGYQYGDRVKIFYQPGTDVALAISGKPSKPAGRRGKRK
jgi:hypothetical protein